MTDLAVLIVLAAASFRVTRFIVDDTLWEGTRERLLAWLIPPRRHEPPVWRAKAWDLIQCYWCVGIWVSFVLVCVFFTVWPWQLGVAGWTAVLAVAGIQSLVATIVEAQIE